MVWGNRRHSRQLIELAFAVAVALRPGDYLPVLRRHLCRTRTSMS